MGGLFSSSAPTPAPLPEPVTREDPSIAEAKKKAKQAELQRKGRRAAIVNSGGGAGLDDDLGSSVSRPEARSAQVLG